MREERQVSGIKRRRLSRDKTYLKVRGHFPELEAALVEWLQIYAIVQALDGLTLNKLQYKLSQLFPT